MDYEKKYNEAIKRAKQHCADYVVETIFPELAESEDERIRNFISNELACLRATEEKGSDRYKELTNAIAWLEKQGKETSWKPSKEEMDVLYGLAYITNQYDEHKEEVITRLYQDLKREFFNGSSYENMFPNTEDGVRRRSTIQVLEYARSLDAYNQYGKVDIDKNIAWLEKQGEQQDTSIQINPSEYINDMEGNGCYLKNTIKPVDEVKPKFKVGDWVFIEEVKGYKNGPFQINTVDSLGYSFDEYHTIPFMYEDLLSKWTIQDAKDGDVLCDYSEAYDNPLIFILKKFECINFGLVRPSDYSSYCFLTAGDIQRFKEGTYHHKHNIEPATKEQRDLLFQKMKEAGYEWDADKKELKKVVDEEQIKKNLQDNSFRRMFEQKSVWGEKDEEILNLIIARLHSHPSVEAEEYDKDYHWFKSLKDRVGNFDDGYKVGFSAAKHNQWKPSDEQMKSFDAVLVYNPPCSNECRNHLITLYNDLEKLRKE